MSEKQKVYLVILHTHDSTEIDSIHATEDGAEKRYEVVKVERPWPFMPGWGWEEWEVEP